MEPRWKDWAASCSLAFLSGIMVGAVHADGGERSPAVVPPAATAYDSVPGRLPLPQENRPTTARTPATAAAQADAATVRADAARTPPDQMRKATTQGDGGRAPGKQKKHDHDRDD